MNYFICIFIIIFLYFLVFNTPFFLINYIYGCSQMNRFNLNYYILKNDNIYIKTFKINHILYDGRLTSMLLKKKNINIKNIKNINNKKGNLEIFKPHNILSNLLEIPKNDTKFSSLNFNVSYLLKFISQIQNKILKVCVIISTRDENNYTQGNFLKFGFFNINKYMDNNEIMKRFKNCVENSRKDSKKFVNIYDILNFLNCDITINSWKDLSVIKNNNGLLMKRFENNIFSKKELLKNLLDGKKGKILFFDKYYDDWVINKIENINILNCKFF